MCYRPPNTVGTFDDLLNQCDESVISRYKFCPMILIGDFNFPDMNWSNCSIASDCRDVAQCTTFINSTQCYGLTQVISSETRESAVLDLFLTNEPETVGHCCSLQKMDDHRPVFMKTKLFSPVQEVSKNMYYNYHGTDALKLNSLLDNFTSKFMSTFDTRSLNDNWNVLKNAMHKFIKKYAQWYN